jgi:translation initiation factor 2 alpha subunit (eIF-2alpha)
MAATDQIQSAPEEDNTIIPTVRQATEYGPYLTPYGCNNMSRFVHRLEMTTACIRNFELYIRPKQKAVHKVIRINKARPEVEKTGSSGGKGPSAYYFVTQVSIELHQRK